MRRARVASRDYLEASEAMRETFRALVAVDLRDRLPRIRASTLLVWGPDATRAWIAALGLGVAMIAPFSIGRPAARGLSVFAAWPLALLAVHVAHLTRSW